jgi:hypothetical protein
MGYTKYETANVDAAIELAGQLKAEGKYDWFRGQVKPWPPYSSAVRLRLTNEGSWQEQGRNRLLRFVVWLQSTPGLQHLVQTRDAVFAIAQHYGIPTDYIDFTTDPSVAGYFACDTKSPEAGVQSCIYCLKTEDLKDLWAMITEAVKSTEGTEIPEIECVSIEVPNLWRLEAQKGAFLYCPTNWDVHYPMDRILFPYTGYPASPTHDDIYPRRKSQLEILLDQYFMNEKLLLANKEMRTIFDNLDNPNKRWIDQPDVPNRVHAQFFEGGSVPPLQLWTAANLERWLRVEPERLNEVTGTTLRLAVRLDGPSEQIKSRVSSGILRILKSHSSVRDKSVHWLLSDPNQTNRFFDNDLMQALHWIWDGMRLLPYADLDISEAMAACVALYHLGFHKAGLNNAALDIATKLFGSNALRLEFGAPDGSYSQGYARIDDLQNAIREDMTSRLLPEYRTEFGTNLRKLLQIIQAPERTFDFDRLASIFARQIIPTQVLSRSGNAVFFSPARLDTLGLP